MKKSLLCLIFIPLTCILHPQITIAYNTEFEPIAHSVNCLRQELALVGEIVQTLHLSNNLLFTSIPSIIVLTKRDYIPEIITNNFKKMDFESIEDEGFEIKWINNGKSLLVLASEEIGAQYAIMELVDHVKMYGNYRSVSEKIKNPSSRYRIIKFNLPWSPYRSGDATSVHTQTVRDIKFWEKFLDMMVENRFNVLSLWNNHPFPYMIRSKNFPDASPFNEKEMEAWQIFWKKLFRLAKQRGIQTFIVNWNIVVSPSFANNYGASQYNDISDLVKKYTRESVTQLINEYEDLTGIGVTLADWMGTFNDSMTPEEREEWIEETFIRGIKDANREVKFLHRSVLAGNPEAMRNLIDRAGFKEPVLVEIKFNWSHGHSTPVLAITHDYHSGELDERFWNPPPENYKIQWMIRNEDFFILRWGQPDFIREHIKLNKKDYVNGYFIGSEGYIPAFDYSHLPTSDKTWQYAFEKQWLFYKIWGRLLYDNDTPDSYFSSVFDNRYGRGTGLNLLQAYKLASNMPLRLASFHKSTWDYTLYSEGFLSAAQSSPTDFFDKSSAFISIDEFIYHETLDPKMVSIPEYIDLIIKKVPVEPGSITPLDLALASENDSRQVLNIIDSLQLYVNNYSGSLNSEIQDLVTWSYLGLYLADKLRAGVALENYRRTGDDSKKKEAEELLERCLTHWDNVIFFTKDRYAPTPHVSSERWGDNFKEFSWELFRPQVVRDIQIAKESVHNKMK